MKIILNRKLITALLALFVVCVFGCLAKPVLLTDAARTGDIDLARDLIDRGADVNKVETGFLTPLGYAAMAGHRDVARLLVARGADIDLALASCTRLKQPFQLRCRKTISEFKAEKDPLPPSRPAAVKPPLKPAQANTSDVDELPPLKTRPNKHAYAIVIGIENYRQKLPRADFAASDAGLVSEYLTKTLGYPEENVIVLLNDRALKSDLEKYIDRWLMNNVEEEGRVFIYYSGHGAPDPKTGGAYLVPYDGDPAFIAETGYPISRLYESLGKLKAREITVILDSCFSGAGGRSVLAKGARPLVMEMNMPALRGNMSVLTASSGNQISSAYEEKRHGLFTYFLLKGIKDEDVVRPDGSLKMDDLFGYIKPQVERIARKQYNSEQTPQLMAPKKDR